MDPEPIFYLNIPFLAVSNISLWLNISLLLLLLFCSALISGAEVAFFFLSQKELDKASQSTSKVQHLVVSLLETPKKLLANILIINNFVNILIVLLFANIGLTVFEPIPETISFFVLTIPIRFLVEVVFVSFLILLFGEVLPKVYATRNALKFASIMAFPLQFMGYVLTLFSMPLLFLTAIIEKLLGNKKSKLSVEELGMALELTSDTETTDEEQKILEGIVSFGNTETAQIMKNRMDIIALSTSYTFQEVLDLVIKNGFSRNPVYEESIDNIKGVLYTKDLLPHLHKNSFDWKSIIREPYFVPENKKLDDLLVEFKEKKNHLAIVVDEYGGTSGIVTLEDVIEEIVGEISDEYNDEDLVYTKIDANNYVFEGKTTLKDLSKVLDMSDEIFEEDKGESETIAGFILELYGKFPKKGDIIKYKHFTFTISSFEKKRIKRVTINITNE